MEESQRSRWDILKILNEYGKSHSHNTAILTKDQSISYGNLGQKSDQIRDLLLSAGIRKRSIVGILIEDTVELVAAIIGILKADCIFVPLDPRHPANRIQAMILTAAPEVFLVQKQFVEMVERIREESLLGFHILVADDLSAASVDSQRTRVLLEEADPSNGLPEDMGYIYFTSGSTGKPKGIAGSLRGLAHFMHWETETLAVNDNFRISQLTPCSFDPFLRDIFLPLCAGGTLCVPPDRESVLDPERLIQWITDTRITLIHCTPSLFRGILNHLPNRNYFPSLKYVVLAGEPLFPADVKRWFSIFDDRIQLVNLYGPTETTLAKFYHFVHPSDQERRIIPVGKPMNGAEGLVLNEARELCPSGAVGEVYIRTIYRSYGYYRQPELTRQVFIQNPFNPDDPIDLLYRSGDIGRVLPDGELELIGRRDNQVKIRGVRVELEEIEQLLRDYEDISDAVVKDWDDDHQQKFLCAYIVSEKVPNTVKLHNFLAQWLPEASVPAVFMKVDELPLNLNGKIDRRALPDPRAKAKENGYVAPRTDIERRITEIWHTILKVPQISIHDTFFSLGSDSLMTTRAVARMRKEFQIEIPLRLLFEHPTVATLAEVLQNQLSMTSVSGHPYPPSGLAAAAGQAQDD